MTYHIRRGRCGREHRAMQRYIIRACAFHPGQPLYITDYIIITLHHRLRQNLQITGIMMVQRTRYIICISAQDGLILDRNKVCID